MCVCVCGGPAVWSTFDLSLHHTPGPSASDVPIQGLEDLHRLTLVYHCLQSPEGISVYALRQELYQAAFPSLCIYKSLLCPLPLNLCCVSGLPASQSLLLEAIHDGVQGSLPLHW